MVFQVVKKSGSTVSINRLLDGQIYNSLALAGAGAVQRSRLSPGGTGEIIRLDHHVTFLTAGETTLWSKHDGEVLAKRNIGRGLMHVNPALVPHLSEWNCAIDITVVSLEPRFLREQCADLFHRDLSHMLPRPRIGFEDPFLWQLGSRLGALVSMPAPPTVFIEQLLASMAMHLAFSSDVGLVRSPGRALSKATVRRVRDYVEAHLGSQIRLSTLAALSKLSSYHFSRQFSRETGISVARYVQLRRMRRAVELLAQSDPDIAEIGEAVGYRDASSFARAFRSVYGLSPQAYRRNLL